MCHVFEKLSGHARTPSQKCETSLITVAKSFNRIIIATYDAVNQRQIVQVGNHQMTTRKR